MKLISLNVGRPRLVAWNGVTVSTGIFKAPVADRVMLHATNLDGDRQADLSVHGGPNKAVYGYPSEHYPYWHDQLPGYELPWGVFGENFTTEGLLETEVSIGDSYRIGSAVIMIQTPRLPCFKLAARFRREDMVERFLRSGYSGFYFSVLQEGEVGAGDSFLFLGGESSTVTIAEMYRLYLSHSPGVDSLQRALEATLLPDSWRERFAAKLATLENGSRI
jgi:MOSC domain-containing protein YiiM